MLFLSEAHPMFDTVPTKSAGEYTLHLGY